MKYGQTFQAQSVPQWAPYNVDYNELKNLIKVNTTKDQGQAIAIPGHVDTALAKFENSFFNELSNQHDRVDLFVSSKADEVGRRLGAFSSVRHCGRSLLLEQIRIKETSFDYEHDANITMASLYPRDDGRNSPNMMPKY